MPRLRLPTRYLLRQPRSPLPSRLQVPCAQAAASADCRRSPFSFQPWSSVGTFPPPSDQNCSILRWGPPQFSFRIAPADEAQSAASRSHCEPVIGLLKRILAQRQPARCLHICGVSSKDVVSEEVEVEISERPWVDSKDSADPLICPSLADSEPARDDSEIDEEGYLFDASEGSGGCPTVVHEAEMVTELYTSTTGTDDSDFSELECEGGDGQSEGEEETQWPASALEVNELDAEENQDASEFGKSDHLNDGEFSEMVSPNVCSQDYSDEFVLHESTSRRPYLHVLSVNEVREILEKARAKDVRVLQVHERCEWVNQLVFATGRSSRHLRGMADALVYKIKQCSTHVGPNSYPTVEGRDGEQWMAVDCGSIVVHLFLDEARSYYNLEEFWGKKTSPRSIETF